MKRNSSQSKKTVANSQASNRHDNISKQAVKPNKIKQNNVLKSKQQNQQQPSPKQKDNNSNSKQKSENKQFQEIAESIKQNNQGGHIQGNEYALTQESINNLVHEYLLKNGLNNTLDVFLQEILQPKNQLVQDESYEVQLLNAFNTGQRNDFFQLWIKFIPTNIRLYDERATKLEFYLNVYFLIYKMHPLVKQSNKLDQESVQFFKQYLESRGSELAKTNEFLHFYALPYIFKPQDHEALKFLFTNEWVLEIKQRLTDFLSNLYPNEQVPLLYHIYQTYIKNNIQQQQQQQPSNQDMSPVSPSLNQVSEQNQQQQQQMPSQTVSKDNTQYMNYITQLENNNKQLLQVIQEYNTKYNALQKSFKDFAEQSKHQLMESQTKWFQVAQDLVLISKDILKIFENQQNGIPYQQSVLDAQITKLGKYEQFLSTNIEELISQSQDLSIFDKPNGTQDVDNQPDSSVGPANIQQLQNQNQMYNKNANLIQENQQVQQQQQQNIIQMQQSMQYTPLDFDKIKQLLQKNENEILICLVLQALRWRVSKTKSSYLRREIIVSYSTYDLVGCKTENDNIQAQLLEKSPKTKEFFLRLVNSMASDFVGRSYLVSSKNLVQRLIAILKNEKSDTVIRKNALGSLQKLSLRRQPQIIMIENDSINYIVQMLKEEKETLSEYSYEYATALFMNLSLRSSGKAKCENNIEDVLNVLNDLLEHDNMQVRTFVNGTLYSLLSRQSLREQAKAMGMNEVFKYLMENSDERFKKQIQYIMDQLNREKIDEDDAQSESNEEDNDVDDIDDEEDVGEEEEQDDLIENPEGILAGEELLKKDYTLQGQPAQEQSALLKSIVDETTMKKQQTQNTNQLNKSERNDVMFTKPATPSIQLSQMQRQNQQNQMQTQQQQNQSQLPVEQDKLRNLPSEMKSRPKLIRTPIQGDRQQAISEFEQSKSIKIDHLQQAVLSTQTQDEQSQKQEIKQKTEEELNIFSSKPKIPRTPPNQD